MDQVADHHQPEDTDTDASTWELQVVRVDPRELLTDRNIRTDARLTREFVADIRERGVRVPIVATATDDGLRVRLGHRRTLAAVEAGLAAVPVLVEQHDGDGKAAEVDRVVDQFAENEHRAGLTSAERIGVVEQLSAFGVTPAQITKKLRVLKRDQVDAALTVSASELAKAATGRYDLTLEQAAAIAEFDNDPDTVTALIAAAKEAPGRFAHVLQRARDGREEQARQQQARAEIAAAGIPVLDGRAPRYRDDGPSRLLAELADADGEGLTVEAHKDCPGHAAHVGITYGYWSNEQAATVLLDDDGRHGQDEWEAVDEDLEDEQALEAAGGEREEGEPEGPVVEWQARYVPEYVCTDYAAHGHQLRWPDRYRQAEQPPASEAEAAARAEAARVQRRVTIDNNKAWRSAKTVRREFLALFLTRKTVPKGAAGWLARSLAHGHHDYSKAASEGHRLACELFGVEPRSGFYTATPDGLLGLLDGVSDARAQVLTLGLVLAAHEAATDVHSWRTIDPATGAYLRFLADHGYTLSDVERLACGDLPAPELDRGDAATST
jgi:ParB family chromosome partitioning protein